MKLNRDVSIDTTNVVWKMYESINYIPVDFMRKIFGSPLPDDFEVSGIIWKMKNKHSTNAHYEKSVDQKRD